LPARRRDLRSAGAPAGHGQGCAASLRIWPSAIPTGELRATGGRRLSRGAWRASSFCAPWKTRWWSSCARNNIDARVEWRIKRLYSIHQKIERSKVSFDQVYEPAGVRVITQDVGACYAVIGLDPRAVAAGAGAHQGLIAIPRANRYQIAAHHGDGRRRPPVRGADQDRRDAPHRGRRHCGALEVQAVGSVVTARDESG